MSLVITRTTPVYRHPDVMGVFVQWKIEDPSTEEYTFAIERSGSPTGPFEPVMSGIKTFHFFDSLRHVPEPDPLVTPANTCTGTAEQLEVVDVRENLNFLSLQRQVYYRVIGTAGSETIEDILAVGDELDRRQALLRRKIQRDITVGFKFNGIPLAILKRRHWGLRCNSCFDKLTKRVTKSKCDECYGTGFEGGYFNPVRVRGRIGVDNIQTQITPQGKVDINQKRLTLLDFPMVEIDDVVCELRQNRRYIVKTVSTTELQTVSVHQQIVLSEIERDSVEYRVVINPDHIPVIY